jgi:hypothetical protein
LQDKGLKKLQITLNDQLAIQGNIPILNGAIVSALPWKEIRNYVKQLLATNCVLVCSKKINIAQ